MNDSPWLHDEHDGLRYRVLLPLDYRPHDTKYPLVVFLHGSGEAGTDNDSQLKNGAEVLARPSVRAAHPCIVVAPQAPPGTTFGGCWYGGPSSTQSAVMSLTKMLSQRSSVDAQRLYGVGFSMGGIGLYDMAVRFPGVFAAIVPIAGDVDVGTAEALARVPLWAFHGERDEAVSNANDRALSALLIRRGAPARYTELPGRGHGIGPDVVADPQLRDWLFSQRIKSS